MYDHPNSFLSDSLRLATVNRPLNLPTINDRKMFLYYQMCKENQSPNEEICPAPAGGCRYAIWNNNGKWCQLAGDDCELVTRENKVLVDTRSAGR